MSYSNTRQMKLEILKHMVNSQSQCASTRRSHLSKAIWMMKLNLTTIVAPIMKSIQLMQYDQSSRCQQFKLKKFSTKIISLLTNYNIVIMNNNWYIWSVNQYVKFMYAYFSIHYHSETKAIKFLPLIIHDILCQNRIGILFSFCYIFFKSDPLQNWFLNA